ncbi:protein phosphatase 2C domain-containing protein [Chitinophaga flava]|uniref:Stage II sporulation protein E (SpoIIE) n=1 Tax=Chitinophaga flava TaxID=2259036 RepID=A0A365XUY5_9BACT|nr:protein phosphatase 2C domain-containing protein [Chitinophaga flava]RBL89831.1 stage II sporulation protein E (SpoIIE) [Chitinophaga flava]
MKIYATLQIGDFHLNHCEDYYLIENIGTDRLLMAVMDGCTMARDSYFASTLVARILKKICITQGYQELYNPGKPKPSLEDQLKLILSELMTTLKQMQEQLLLEQQDLLTTLILFLADKKENTGIILTIGDGLVSINGHLTEFDHDNKPDYLGFHLHQDFDQWYHSLTQKIFVPNIQHISIATDGILFFKPCRNVDIPLEDPVELLLHDKSDMDKDDMLDRKLKTLEHVYGLRPTDDIAIIRVIQ